MRREITAFPSPLATAPVESDDRVAHVKAKQIIELKPELCASHTVMVVDNSGSMSTHDIHLHRDRQVAAYSMTSLEFIAEQLFSGTANNSDVVSLVEFRRAAKTVFSREPISWVLYNKLLSRRDERNYVSRVSDKCSDRFDSNYLPALDNAEKLLDSGDHDNCALSLLFLSDGAPSDKNMNGLTPTAAKKKICRKIQMIASKYPGRLTIKLVGFGNELDDFSVLQEMEAAVNTPEYDVKAEFVYCEKIANEIGTAVSSLVTSISESRTTLMREGRSNKSRTKREVDSEAGLGEFQSFHFFRIVNHYAYHPRSHRLIPYRGLPFGAVTDENKVEARRRSAHPPPYLALSPNYFGCGAERLAFRCQLSDSMGRQGLTLGPMVAKETNLVERIEENVEFHTKFCETQDLADHLAQEFNHRLKGLPDYNKSTTPVIKFLRCSVLLLDDKNWPGRKRGVLVESMLDTDAHSWCKWNDNAGGINGRAAHVPIDIERELAKLMIDQSGGLEEIIEGSEEEESDDDSSVESLEVGYQNAAVDFGGINAPLATDYVQAFSHFTYIHTNRKLLVCDLQGIYNDAATPPRFELTDPAIHYRSSRRREMVYGRTDKGTDGIQLFFKTHKCTKICKLMQLSGKNKRWRKDWKHKQNINGHR